MNFVKKLTTFSYPQSKYTLYKDSNLLIKPIFDGTKCEFSIDNDLPKDITLNRQNGEISGKVSDKMNEYEYTIKCKNIWKEIETKLIFEIKDIHFDEDNKGEYIELDDEKIKIKCINTPSKFYNTMDYCCFLNCKIKKDENICIKFKYDGKDNDVLDLDYQVMKRGEIIIFIVQSIISNQQFLVMEILMEIYLAKIQI